MTDTRPCTCPPDERQYPCQHQYALGLCRKAEIRSLRTALDRLIAQIADMQKLRLEDELIHGNVMGRIAIALFGDQNNRTDEECVARAAEIGYELSGAKLRAERAEAELAAAQKDLSVYKSARFGYASEFPFTADGEPDVGNIHANIRAMKAELAAALENVKDYRENSALFLRQRDEARTELAAARALLREVREWIPYYRWIPDLRERVDAAIVDKAP